MKKEPKKSCRTCIIVKSPMACKPCPYYKPYKRILTGKELRIAIAKRLKVHYTEKYYSPLDKHLNFKGECILEKAKIGYYIGNSDIDPADYKNDDDVAGEIYGGYFEVCTASKVKYT